MNLSNALRRFWRRFFLAFTLGIACSLFNHQHPWQQTFGGPEYDEGRCIRQTSDGGYIVAGLTFSYGARDGDACLFRLDVHGNLVWKRTYGGLGLDAGYSVEQASDRGYMLIGTSNSFSSGPRVYLVRTDSGGETLWTRTYGGTAFAGGYSSCRASDDGYFIAGWTGTADSTARGVYLVKTNALGETLWTRRYGDSGDDWANSVDSTSDGGCIVAGVSSSNGSQSRYAYFLRVGSLGETLWTRRYGGVDDALVSSVQRTFDGGYIATGARADSGQAARVWLLKLNSSGETLWTRTSGGQVGGLGCSVRQTTDSGYVVSGVTLSGASDTSAYFLKTDSLGVPGIVGPIGGAGSSAGYSVRQTSDDGWIVAGRIRASNSSDFDILVIKIGADGSTEVP